MFYMNYGHVTVIIYWLVHLRWMGIPI